MSGCCVRYLGQLEYSRRCVSVERLIRAAESVRAKACGSPPRGAGYAGALASPALHTPPGTPRNGLSSTGASTSGLYSVGSSGGGQSSSGNVRVSHEDYSDVCDSLRQQRQRDVLTMERCLLEQWFSDLPTIPLPLKVPLHNFIIIILFVLFAVF